MAFFMNLWIAFVHILKAPYIDPTLLWMILPIWVLWIALIIYFTRYKKEQLGWNTALGNGVSLAWICIAVIRDIFKSKDIVSWKFFIILLLLIYGIFITYISFKHKMKTKLAYELASPSVIFYLSTLAVLWGYGALVLSGYVIIDLVILFLIILGATKVFEHFLRKKVLKKKK